MNALGVDPGLGTTGWAVVRREGSRLWLLEAGAVQTDAKRPLEARLQQLFETFSSVAQAQAPTAMALEALYSSYTHPQTAILMGHARGIACLCAALAGVPVFHYSPAQVKRALTGNGRASKEQVQGMVTTLLGLDRIPQPADIADAIALAVCHLNVAVVDARTQADQGPEPGRSPRRPPSPFGIRTRRR